MNIQKFALAFALTLSVVSLGCTNGVFPHGSGQICNPGELGALDCNLACESGSTQQQCNDSGTGWNCVRVEGHVCLEVPPAACGGAAVGDPCDVCGVDGITACVGEVVRCVPDHAPIEICSDGIDNNCDGRTDEGCAPMCTPSTEICDDRDNDCDGSVDEGCDDDNDGYCDSGMTVGASGAPTCPHTPPGGAGDDCNDLNPGVHPGAAEICDDGVDNDCDGSTDEGCSTCTPTNGGVEICDGIDNNCNGFTDEGDVCGTTCSENFGGTLTIHPGSDLRASCSRGLVIIAWGPGGTEFRSGAGATTFTIPMSTAWRGYVRVQAFCPNPGVDGTVVDQWDGGTTNWSSQAGRTLRQVGFTVDVDGRDISDAGMVCIDDGVGYKPTVPLDECSSFICP